MTYNILHNNINLDPIELFQLHSSIIIHGYDYKFFNPHVQRLVRSKNFSIRAINHWNNLPPNIVNVPSVNFKKNLQLFQSFHKFVILHHNLHIFMYVAIEQDPQAHTLISCVYNNNNKW